MARDYWAAPGEANEVSPAALLRGLNDVPQTRWEADLNHPPLLSGCGRDRPKLPEEEAPFAGA